jgi:CDGSH-type Zn-finger protein
MPESDFRIEILKNGPYKVSGGVPLTAQRIVLNAAGECLEWRQTKRFSDKPDYLLCRCGKSIHKPYCDSTHTEVKFNGSETAGYENYLEQCQKLTGPELILTDARALCAHAGFCDRAAGIWRLIQDKKTLGASRIAIEEACNCPSGRLVVWDKEGKALEPSLEPSIAVVESPDGGADGPIWVRGGIPIISSIGKAYEIRNRVTLCGCGRSANKPFCDGAHRQAPRLT